MKRLVCYILLILIAVCTAGCATAITEPDTCCLCDQFPRHAPCVVNLNTGELVELEIYQPHETLFAEIANEQPGGTFYMVHSAGVEGYVDTAIKASVSVSTNDKKMDQQHFCVECRNLLIDHGESGYIVADLRSPETPVVYTVTEGATFSFRCYEISITKDSEEKEYDILVLGTYE